MTRLQRSARESSPRANRRGKWALGPVDAKEFVVDPDAEVADPVTPETRRSI